ncbi:hypothetical protein [Runella sp.]|uniref:hypothetical protein n=1 Tax=Runella sp. TaxID=1960881 RepID=UPI003D141D08
MKKRDKNTLFNLISELGFNQRDFELVDEYVDNLPATIIKYKNTQFIFVIRNSKESFDDFDFKFIQFGPSYEFTEYYPDVEFVNFESVYKSFRSWILNHIVPYIEEITEQDLWELYKSSDKSLNLSLIDFNDKSYFLPDEIRQISTSINELKFLIHKNLSTNITEQNLVIERLDYLIESSQRLNKFDWKSLVLSTLIGISTTLTLDTQTGKILFDLFKKAFSTLPTLFISH